VRFVAITLYVASQRVFIVISLSIESGNLRINPRIILLCSCNSCSGTYYGPEFMNGFHTMPVRQYIDKCHWLQMRQGIMRATGWQLGNVGRCWS
jgi:hypothetical protein